MDLICRALSWNISIKNVSYSFLYFVSRNPEIMLPNNLNGVEYPAILKTYLIFFYATYSKGSMTQTMITWDRCHWTEHTSVLIVLLVNLKTFIISYWKPPAIRTPESEICFCTFEVWMGPWTFTCYNVFQIEGSELWASSSSTN